MNSNPTSPIRSTHAGSPHTSIDSHTATSPPFFQSLQQRFRRGSLASRNTSVDTFSGSEDPTIKSEASKSAKRLLLSTIRDDWVYPITHGVNVDEILPPRDPRAYHIRELGLSDLDAEDGANARAKKRGKQDPYKFEDPDAVASLIKERTLKRKRVVQEELEWNVGMKNWIQQRDAWTGAVDQKPRIHPPAVFVDSPTSIDGLPNGRSNPPSPIKRQANQKTGSKMSTNSEKVSSVADLKAADVHEGPWLPIYPPFLGDDHPISSRIQATAYPTIYSKVVVQSLAPNIPIPLTHMTAALVEGWKQEGNWPPGPSAVATGDLKTGKRSSAFGMWRKEQEGGGKGSKGRVRRSIGGAMKKVLGVTEDPVEELGIEFREQDEEEKEEQVTIDDTQTNGHG